MTKKEKEDELNIYSSEKLLRFSPKVNNNNNSNKNKSNYEFFNIVSETGDSIYSPQHEKFTTLDDIGQVFVSEFAIEEIVNRIIDHYQRLGSSLNNNKNGN